MGSSNKSSTTKTNTEIPEQFMDAYNESLGMARTAANTPYQAYGGQLVAGLNDTQLQGISNINAAYGMAQPYLDRGVALSEQAAKGITPELYNQFYSPYVRDVANSTFGNMMESNAQQLSGLKGGAIQAGAFGGDRSGIAAAELARQQNLALGQTMSGIYNQGYTQAMGLAGQQVQNLGAMGQQIAGLGVGMQGAALQGGQAQLAAGAQQQATEQAQLQALYDQYTLAQAYPYQQAQFFANIAQGLGSTAGGTSTTTAPGPSIGSQIVGGLGAVGSIASISDERVKENIQPVGKLNDGQTVYRYNFKGDPTTHIGLIAQEVEQHRPQSVKDIDGIKGVDYHDATDEAASMASMGGSVGLGRAGFADGGVPFAPWGQAVGWVPEGKLGMAGSNRAPEPPKPYEDKPLGEDWGGIKPLTSDQIGGLQQIALDAGIPLPGSSTNPSQAGNWTSPVQWRRGGRVGLASGGVPFDDFFDRTLQFEGGLNPRDTNGTPSNMGINAKANPDVDVAGLDKEGARRIYKERYWDAVDGDSLSAKDPGLAAAVADTAVLAGPGKAKALLSASGGDPRKFMELRGQFLNGLVASNPQKYGKYAKAWAGRDAALADLTAGRGVAGSGVRVEPVSDVPPPDSADSPTTPPEDSGRGLSRFFASDTNPSIIESIMGRRMSPEARNALLTASLATLAGRSPFMGVNIGEGGRAGMQTYYNALAQKRENIKTASEVQKRGAETQGLTIDQKKALYQLYQQSALNYNVYKKDGQPPFVSFAEWAKQFGFPNLDIQGPPTPDNKMPSPMIGTAPLPAPEGPSASSVAPGAPAAPADDKGEAKEQPPGGSTVLADPSEGPNPNNPNTLPYWQHIASGWAANQGQISLASPEQAATYIAQQKLANDRIAEIQGSDAYKNFEQFNSQYQRTLAGLEKLAKINSEYRGGGLGDVKAEIVRTLQGMGVTVPEDWANEASNFDMTMKGAMDLALRNAGQLGALAHAPASLMDAEGRITPTAMMDPVARYDIIRRAIADLYFNNDMYNTWDQGPNFAQHQSDFNKKNDYNKYLEYATKQMPMPSVSPGQTVPGKKPPEVVPEKTINSALSSLTTKFPDAPVGTNKYLKIGNTTLRFIKANDGWRVVE